MDWRKYAPCSNRVREIALGFTSAIHSRSFEKVGAGALHLGKSRGHPKLTPVLRGPCPHKKIV